MHVQKLLKSLLNKNYEDFPLLIQIVRQNLQNPECSDGLIMLFNNGFNNLLEQILNNFLPANINLDDIFNVKNIMLIFESINCLLYTSPSPRDLSTSRMPSSA